MDKNQNIVTGEFFTVATESKAGPNPPILFERFTLHLDKHAVS